MKLSPFLILLAFSALMPPRAFAACDPTTLVGVTFETDADSMVFHDVIRDRYSTMGYDYRAGRFFGHCVSCFLVGRIRGSDTYRIQGTPAGVPIPVHVEFRVVLNGGTGALCSDYHCQNFSFAKGSLYSSQGSDSAEACACSGGATASCGLALQVMPDEDFTIGYGFESGTGTDGFANGAVAEATVHFSGVPLGAELVSCHGVNDAAVTTLPSTWGRLKAAYR